MNSIRLKLKARLPPSVIGAGDAFLRPLKRIEASLSKPVFIWGNAQSGTFLLYDLLGLTGQFSYPWTEWPRKKGLAAQKYAFPRNRTPQEGLLQCWSGVNLPFEKSDGWKFDRELCDVDTDLIDFPKVLRRYAALSLNWRWKTASVVRILDKCPTYVFMLRAIERLFPDALHIWCIRDPRLVLSSIIRRFVDSSYEPSFRGYASGFSGDIMLPGWQAYRETPMEVRHAWQIARCLNICRQWKDRLGERCLTVHHEDLCNRPVTIFKEISEFVGISVRFAERMRTLDGQIKAVKPKVWPASNGEHDNAKALFLNPSTISQLGEIEELALRLGYDARMAGKRICALPDTSQHVTATLKRA